MKFLKPFLNYHGSKWRASPNYPAPRHDIIIEPFAGAAGYALHHYKKNVLLIDKNPAIASVWQYLISATEDEIISLPDLKTGETIRDLNIPAAAQNLIGLCIGKNCTDVRLTPTSWFEKYKNTNAAGFWGSLRRQRIASQLQFIRHWQIVYGEYSTVTNIKATWFIDPPYQYKGRRYVCGPKDIDFNDLADWCLSRKGQVLVCEHTSASWLPFEPFLKSQATIGTCDEALFHRNRTV